MPAFKLFCDSMSDVPSWFSQERDITVLSAHYTLDGREYEDIATDEANHKFYNFMREGKAPTTSQVNTEQYLKLWTPLVESGTPILQFCFSSALSGTYNSALIAKDIIIEKHPAAEIYVCDTLSASGGGALLLHMLCDMRDAGKSAVECYEWLEANKLRAHHWFTVDSLETLKRGGRISSAAAAIGTMLNIKPVLNVNAEGKLIPRIKAKGRKNALKALVDKFGELATRSEDEIVWLTHADVPQEAEQLAETLKEQYGIKKIWTGRIGALVGTHAGPGTMALFFMGPVREV